MFAPRPLEATLSPPSPEDLTTHLVQKGDLAEIEARRALSACSGSHLNIARTLLDLGLLDEIPLFEALSELTAVPLDALEAVDGQLPDELGLDSAFLKRVMVVPVRKDDDALVLATSDIESADILEAIAFKLDCSVRPVLATPSAVSAALSRTETDASNGPLTEESDADRLRAMASDGPVIRLVNDLIGRAMAESASDIHIEADGNGASIRIRVDGALRQEGHLTSAMFAAVVSRLKIMARLNISEKRRPQDGRASLIVRGRPVDLRLSTLPIQHGESVVLRILDQRRLNLDWDSLGYNASRIADIRTLIGAPNGIVLVAGPTGSGKTTTLYTALAELNRSDRKIITVEDPVEYRLPGIVQVQVEPEIGMTFAATLRSILRQDPNVVMVGEIRDAETAEIAVRAAQTGRLVLSTVHTNDAVSTIDRLLDLGVAPFLLGATLRGVLSQRLIRRVCPSCAGEGCLACGKTGASGRIVISDLLKVDSSLSEAIAQGVSGARLRTLLAQGSYHSLRDEGEGLLRDGLVRHEDLLEILGAE